MVLAASLAPKGLEGSFFALFSSIMNCGFIISSILGSFITQIFQIDTGNYNQLWILLLIRVVLTLLSIPLVNLLPTESSKDDEEYVELEVLDDSDSL